MNKIYFGNIILKCVYYNNKMTDNCIVFMIIDQEYARLTNGVMGVTTLVHDLLNNSNSTDDMIVESKQENPNFTIDELNKFYIKCVNGNLTGSKLWIAYKFSDKNTEKLLKNVEEWNEEMVKHVNDNCKPGWVQNPEILIPMDAPSDEMNVIYFKVFH